MYVRVSRACDIYLRVSHAYYMYVRASRAYDMYVRVWFLERMVQLHLCMLSWTPIVCMYA